jgi:hypothetical protein
MSYYGIKGNGVRKTINQSLFLAYISLWGYAPKAKELRKIILKILQSLMMYRDFIKSLDKMSELMMMKKRGYKN